TGSACEAARTPGAAASSAATPWPFAGRSPRRDGCAPSEDERERPSRQQHHQGQPRDAERPVGAPAVAVSRGGGAGGAAARIRAVARLARLGGLDSLAEGRSLLRRSRR